MDKKGEPYYSEHNERERVNKYRYWQVRRLGREQTDRIQTELKEVRAARGRTYSYDNRPDNDMSSHQSHCGNLYKNQSPSSPSPHAEKRKGFPSGDTRGASSPSPSSSSSSSFASMPVAPNSDTFSKANRPDRTIEYIWDRPKRPLQRPHTPGGLKGRKAEADRRFMRNLNLGMGIET